LQRVGRGGEKERRIGQERTREEGRERGSEENREREETKVTSSRRPPM
jgi:hypothetical protein